MIFSSRGVLGINARNQNYLRTPRRIRRILDSKLLTKKVLKKAGLPVLEAFDIIKTSKELLDFDFSSLPNSFALKPNRGFGGGGIIIVYGRRKKALQPTWITAGGFINEREIKTHIFDVLDGNFSLFSLPDAAFFEERAKVVKDLKPYSFRGIPDIRIIVFEGVPMMAMLRLPTKESKGRGNLHQGAIGVGIDLGSGFTTSAIWRRRFIDYYPGTRYLLRGIKIPHFKKVLNLAILAAKELNAKFLGVDITIDKEKGPVILELNARPGLEIQLANLDGLKDRLERVKGIKPKSEKRGVRLAQDLFGEGELAEEELLDKKILGAVEEVEIVVDCSNDKRMKTNNERMFEDSTKFNQDLLGLRPSPLAKGEGLRSRYGCLRSIAPATEREGGGEKRYKILTKIDTGAWRSSVSFEIAKELGLEKKGEETWVRSSLGEELRIAAPLTFYLAGEKIETEVFWADRSKMQYKMIIGRRDLKKFIIDPSRNIYKTPLY